MYVLEKACRIQVAAQAGGRLVTPTAESIRVVHGQLEGFGDVAGLTWAALLRHLDRTEPGYRD
jgi:ribulose-5-phosphate 4-epimerase/fuculose-1-phosphate aldolase